MVEKSAKSSSSKSEADDWGGGRGMGVLMCTSGGAVSSTGVRSREVGGGGSVNADCSCDTEGGRDAVEDMITVGTFFKYWLPLPLTPGAKFLSVGEGSVNGDIGGIAGEGVGFTTGVMLLETAEGNPCCVGDESPNDGAGDGFMDVAERVGGGSGRCPSKNKDKSFTGAAVFCGNFGGGALGGGAKGGGSLVGKGDDPIIPVSALIS